jgi:hypothetical protein
MMREYDMWDKNYFASGILCGTLRLCDSEPALREAKG